MTEPLLRDLRPTLASFRALKYLTNLKQFSILNSRFSLRPPLVIPDPPSHPVFSIARRNRGQLQTQAWTRHRVGIQLGVHVYLLL